MMNNISKINLKGTSYDIKDKLVRDSIGVPSSETSLGIAPLDASGKVPSENLPSYVDDVIEGYYNNGAFYKESAHTTLISGETGKIYVDLDANKTYRWSGSLYIVITDGVIGKDGATWFTGTYFNFRSGYANTPYNLASQNGFGEAKPGDFYLNTSNGDVYKFIEASGTTNKLVGYLCNIKGANGSNGANGTDGITPSISATATVNNSTGTPSVTVTKSGTDANPSFDFAFSNIKGDPGNAGVTGVKGSSEGSYRTGNVNITPANIGLGNVDNTADADKSVAYASVAGSAPAHSYIVPEGDNRNVSTHPTDYTNDLIFRGLKYSNIIDYPSSDTYQYLVGLKGWSDSSGGDAWEVAFNNSGINVRHGADNLSWSSWYKLATTSDIPTSLPANGGNADTVDGYHYNNLPYLPTSGGTMTGTLVVNAGSSKFGASLDVDAYKYHHAMYLGDHGTNEMKFYEDAFYFYANGGNATPTVYIGDNTDIHSGNWSNFITIPTVYDWAKASTKPSYTASEVGISSSVQAITSNTSSSCSITGSSNDGKSQTVIYTNSTSSDLTVTVPTTYKTPDGAAIELTCKAGGYCEVNYLNIGGTIYARGL